ncbi:MAG TPA: alpha/beta hydrolase [Microbacterium sp.]|nr:alpha/beta hydrolase [Microbacterium sp.]
MRRLRTLAARARAWLLDYAYALVAQVRAALDRTDPAVFRDGDRVPIIVLPGIYESWHFLLPLITAMHGHGHPVHVVDALRRNGRPVTESAIAVLDYLHEHDLRGAVIVAHSKGGLIGKQAMISGAAPDQVRGMVAIATPFGGSTYARFFLNPALRGFSPRDATIRALLLETAVNARIVSVYGSFDPHIPGGSALPGARNVILETMGHFRVLGDARVLDEVERLAG